MKTKMGIIGAGNIANKFTIGAKLTSNAEVYAVASRSIEKSEAFAKKHDIPNFYGSYEEILADKNVEAIYIAVPHSHHYDIAVKCIEAGKAVLCEKPMLLDVEHCEKLTKLAKEKNVLLMEAMWTRFIPAITQAHKWIAEGKIGDVRLIDAKFGFNAKFDPESRLYNKALAGGAIYDVGVYVIELAMDFAKSKIKQYSVFGTFGKTDVDEVTSINLKFENEVLANLHCAVGVHTNSCAMIYGTKGYIEIPMFYASSEAFLKYPDAGIEKFHAGENTGIVGFRHEVEHFCDLFQNGKIESPRITHADNIECCKIFENLFENK